MAQSTQPPAAAARGPASSDVLAQLSAQVQQRLRQFEAHPPTPAAVYALEQDLRAAFDAAGRALLQETFHRLEPADRDQAAPRVRYHGETYRINKRTPAQVATAFGPITVWSWLYLCCEDGAPGLHPLHVVLGLGAGRATPVLAERIARRAVDDTPQGVRRWLAAEHGLVWSNDRLRAALRDFRRRAVAFRAEAQRARLLHWLRQAVRSRGRHRPAVAVGRDGVMVPIRGHGYQEASAATVAVYDRRGRRLGTVYLAQMPEAHQATLTAALTDLVRDTLRHWHGPPPRLVYVTDKGQAQDDFYRTVLRRMADPRRPGRRLAWEWVLDCFHVCAYVARLRAALFGAGGQGWYGRMRHWLRHRDQGVAHLLRSAVQHYHRRRLSAAARAAFWQAYRYLRRHRRWMDYPRYHRLGLPLGSGVTEAACKTVFTQRLKRAGMRWHKDSGQVIVDLRVLQLSGIWDDVVRQDLQSRALPQTISYQPPVSRTRSKAA